MTTAHLTEAARQRVWRDIRAIQESERRRYARQGVYTEAADPALVTRIPPTTEGRLAFLRGLPLREGADRPGNPPQTTPQRGRPGDSGNIEEQEDSKAQALELARRLGHTKSALAKGQACNTADIQTLVDVIDYLNQLGGHGAEDGELAESMRRWRGLKKSVLLG
jgi:hypothetical protein